MIKVTENGATEMYSDETAEWLISCAGDGMGLPRHQDTDRWHSAAEEALDQRLAHASTRHLHPENRQWTAAAWRAEADS